MDLLDTVGLPVPWKREPSCKVLVVGGRCR
jgi:hypothetical protein